MYKTSILIVTGDVFGKLAKKCIRSVKKHTPADLVREIIILEAGIRPDFNHAAEINKVLKIFSGDALVLLDDDAVVQRGWLEGLIRCAEADTHTGIVGGVLEDPKGKINHSGATTSDKYFGWHYEDPITAPRECKYVCSAVMLIKREVVEKIGGFDETFKKYGQESDYCMRAWEAGFKVKCTPDTRAQHIIGATIEQRPDISEVWQHDRDVMDQKWKGSPYHRHFDISRRGVTYPTHACNIKCCFCYYYDKAARDHRPIDEMKAEMDQLRREYKLEYVDITGGEPTIYKHIHELVEHCASIGLMPTVITNGQRPDVVAELLDAGLEDVLLSVHGYEQDCNLAMNKKDAYDRVKETIEVLTQRDFGFRTNTTLISHNYQNLPKMADELATLGARIANLISFNPHEGTDWASEENVEFQVPYSQLAPYAKQAIDRFTDAGVWANVRYFPLCQLQGYEKHVCNFHQWQWDPYEWEYLSGYHMKKEDRKKIRRAIEKHRLFGNSPEDMVHLWIAKHRSCENNVFFSSCEKCANRPICDGIYPQYVRRFGEEEFVPIEGDPITDPLYYRRLDTPWAVLKPSPA
ncbi:MAG: radical SAM protein [Planctomycetes bacterium]|nr:radical SAM protein [Planctomycetota bacterium]